MFDSEFLPDAPTYPNGCLFVRLKLTLKPAVLRLSIMLGSRMLVRFLNRDLVEGQMQGGIVQGIGQALGENSALRC